MTDHGWRERMEEKIDRLLELNVEAKIHAAVCDSEREDIKENLKSHKATLTKVILALTGAGVLGGGAVEAIRALLG